MKYEMQLSNKCDKQQFIFTFGNHKPLKGPVCNPFSHRYFGDQVPKKTTFSQRKLPNMTEYSATQNNTH